MSDLTPRQRQILDFIRERVCLPPQACAVVNLRQQRALGELVRKRAADGTRVAA